MGWVIISIKWSLAAAVLLLGVSPGTDFVPRELSDAEEQARRIFPNATAIYQTTVPLPDETKETIWNECSGNWIPDELVILLPVMDDSLLGYVVLDNVTGKDQLITYIVAVTNELAVNDIEIITYREPYGHEVGYESWQKQFYGKKPEETLRPGREIRNISGATISVRAVTFGVRKVLCTLELLKDQLPSGDSD